MNIDFVATVISLLTIFGISAIIALSLNLEYGLAGIPNFGQALFVSIGAYTAGWTYTRLLPLLAGREVIDPCGSTLGQALRLRGEIMRTLPAIGFAQLRPDPADRRGHRRPRRLSGLLSGAAAEGRVVSGAGAAGGQRDRAHHRAQL